MNGEFSFVARSAHCDSTLNRVFPFEANVRCGQLVTAALGRRNGLAPLVRFSILTGIQFANHRDVTLRLRLYAASTAVDSHRSTKRCCSDPEIVSLCLFISALR